MRSSKRKTEVVRLPLAGTSVNVTDAGRMSHSSKPWGTITVFAPKAFLRQMGTELHVTAALATSVLRGYAKAHPDTEVGKQAAELAELCHQLKTARRLKELMELLSPRDHKHRKPAQWATLFEQAALMIAPPPIKITHPSKGEVEKSAPAGLRYDLKEGNLLHRKAAFPKHPWPHELKEAVTEVAELAATINRLRPASKRWKKVFEDLASMARFQAGHKPR